MSSARAFKMLRPSALLSRLGTPPTKLFLHLHRPHQPSFASHIVVKMRMTHSKALQFSAPGHRDTLRHYLGLGPLSGSSPDTPPSERDVIFIAIDLEAWEFDQRMITEVGIATLDTRDLREASEWWPGSVLSHVSAHHFIIKNHEKRVNRKWVSGCPDKFDFGVSKKVPLHTMRDHLDAAFVVKDRLLELTEDGDGSPHGSAVSETARKMVLVGHDLKGDIKYLNDLDFSPTAARTVVAQIDTQRIAREMDLAPGLSKLLNDLGIYAKNLHNAGNDAMYTMKALVLMAVYGREIPFPPVTLAAMENEQKRRKELKAKQEALAAERLALEEKVKLEAEAKKLAVGLEKVTIVETEEGEVEEETKVSTTLESRSSDRPDASGSVQTRKTTMRIVKKVKVTEPQSQLDKDNDLTMRDDDANTSAPPASNSPLSPNTPTPTGFKAMRLPISVDTVDLRSAAPDTDKDNDLAMTDDPTSTSPPSLLGSNLYASSNANANGTDPHPAHEKPLPRQQSLRNSTWSSTGVHYKKIFGASKPRRVSKDEWRKKGPRRQFSGLAGLRSGGCGRRRLADEPSGWDEYPKGPLDY